MKSDAKTPAAYMKELPAERRKELEPVLALIRKKMPKGFEEAMGFGMINWQVPLKRLPVTYNKQPLMYAALASQKNHLAVYLMGVYGDGNRAKAFKEAFAKEGKKLDAGKSCIRFNKLNDLSLKAIGDNVGSWSMEEYITYYENTHPSQKKAQAKAKASKSAKKTVKNVVKKTAKKK